MGQVLAEDHPNLAEHDPLAGTLQQGETVAPNSAPGRLSDIRAQLSVHMLLYRQRSEPACQGSARWSMAGLEPWGGHRR